jgi:hypothetical protein
MLWKGDTSLSWKKWKSVTLWSDPEHRDNSLRQRESRTEVERKLWGDGTDTLFLGEGGILLEGSQEVPDRPSYKDRVTVKTLGW